MMIISISENILSHEKWLHIVRVIESNGLTSIWMMVIIIKMVDERNIQNPKVQKCSLYCTEVFTTTDCDGYQISNLIFQI